MLMEIEFSGEVWYWKGPAPWYFITVPAELGRALHTLASAVTYGWGMIPANVLIGDTEWRTALWPKDGSKPISCRSRSPSGSWKLSRLAMR